VRLAFYLAEACVLAIPLAGGLLLGERAARAWGRQVPHLTWPRVGMVALFLAGFDTLTGELFGPRVILQYYLAGLVFTAGVALWVLSRTPSR